MRVHHTIACTNHGLWIDLISKPDTGSDVLVIVIDRSAAVAGVGTSARELQYSIDSGNRVHQIGIEEAHVVMRFAERREEVVANAKIQGQLFVKLPIVLNVGRDGTETRPELLHEVLSK